MVRKVSFFNALVILMVLACIGCCSFAQKVPGYIIDQNLDTISGTILLPKFDQVTGGYIFDGFDLADLNYRVSFKSRDKKNFQSLFPDEISGFGFTYKSNPFVFKSFLIEYNSMLKRDRYIQRFLLLVHDGRIDLYRDTQQRNYTTNGNGNDAYTANSYYLYNSSKGLIKAEMNDLVKSVSDLLIQFDVDPEFIDEIPGRSTFKDLNNILDRYDEWLSNIQ